MLYTIIPQAKLPRNISGLFTYSGEETYTPGDLVIVEFRKRKILGLVVEESKEKNLTPSIKQIQEKIALSPDHILPLVQWMADYYVISPAFIWDTISPVPVKPKTSQPKIPPTVPTFGDQSERRAQAGWKSPINSLKLPIASFDTDSVNTYSSPAQTKYAHFIKGIKDTWKKGASVMLLTPTVADLAYLVQFVPKKWHDKTILFTSELYKSKLKYYQAWEGVLTTYTPLLVLGTRSAIFAPLHNLGLIIIDKAQSDDYKQYDQNPRYDARKAAQKIGELTGCGVKMFSDGVVIC
jgi:primosomal protein N'